MLTPVVTRFSILHLQQMMTLGAMGFFLAIPPELSSDNYLVFQPFLSFSLFSWFPSISLVRDSADTHTVKVTLGALSAPLLWGVTALP